MLTRNAYRAKLLDYGIQKLQNQQISLWWLAERPYEPQVSSSRLNYLAHRLGNDAFWDDMWFQEVVKV